MVGGTIVLAVVVAAVFAPVVAPCDPTAQNATALLRSPSSSHPLGTDEQSRDTLSRVIHGARVSLQVGGIAAGLSLVTGGSLGLVSGYAGGAVA